MLLHAAELTMFALRFNLNMPTLAKKMASTLISFIVELCF